MSGISDQGGCLLSTAVKAETSARVNDWSLMSAAPVPSPIEERSTSTVGQMSAPMPDRARTWQISAASLPNGACTNTCSGCGCRMRVLLDRRTRTEIAGNACHYADEFGKRFTDYDPAR